MEQPPLTPIEIRRKTCLNKKVYIRQSIAVKRAKQRKQRVYECPFCGFYHLTRKRVT